MKLILVFSIVGIISILTFMDQPMNNHLTPFSEEYEIHLQDTSKLAFCYTCHNPKAESHDEMLAPPLAGIKMQYMRQTGTREAFIQRMADFVKNPTEEAAIMKGPVKRFGLMPKPALTAEEIESIVAYIYDNEIPQPSWYEEHHKKMHGDQ